MKPIQTVFAILLIVFFASCASPERTNAPVTVLYEATYVTTSGGEKIQKVVMIPWIEGLTLMRTIASAGGYSLPPHRHIYLVRDGRSTLLPDPRQIVRSEDDMHMKPGDRIEFRKSQNQ